jgi:gamma-glutamylcyclotransferase (GGCT)/AIG2-like uncharacterized protein YtfP
LILLKNTHNFKLQLHASVFKIKNFFLQNLDLIELKFCMKKLKANIFNKLQEHLKKFIQLYHTMIPLNLFGLFQLGHSEKDPNVYAHNFKLQLHASVFKIKNFFLQNLDLIELKFCMNKQGEQYMLRWVWSSYVLSSIKSWKRMFQNAHVSGWSTWSYQFWA